MYFFRTKQRRITLFLIEHVITKERWRCGAIRHPFWSGPRRQRRSEHTHCRSVSQSVGCKRKKWRNWNWNIDDGRDWLRCRRHPVAADLLSL